MSFSKEKYLPYISKILLNYLFKTHFQKKISEVWFYNVLSAYGFEIEENTSQNDVKRFVVIHIYPVIIWMKIFGRQPYEMLAWRNWNSQKNVD